MVQQCTRTRNLVPPQKATLDPRDTALILGILAHTGSERQAVVDDAEERIRHLYLKTAAARQNGHPATADIYYLRAATLKCALAATLRDLADATRAVDRQLHLLDEEDLSNLRAALDDARNRLSDLKDEADEARDAIAQLNAEIAAEKGDDETARRLELEIEQRKRLGELEKALEQARAAGNRELVTLYEEQRGKLNQLYRLKEQNLEADLRGEESGQRTKSTLTEIADEAERASRAIGGLGGVDLSGLQSQTDRLKTSFTDLNAVL